MPGSSSFGTRANTNIVLVVAGLLAVVVAVVVLLGVRDARADTAYDAEELEFLGIINDYRQDRGLPTLILSDALTLASERHNEDMGRYGFFAHDTASSDYFPDGSEPWDRMALSGYDYPDSYRAENLAAGYETAEEAFVAWRESPGHNKNMLDGNQRVVGIARLQVPGSPFEWYWTTDFGSNPDPTSHAPNELPAAEREAQQQKAQQQQQREAQEQQRAAQESAAQARREARQRAAATRQQQAPAPLRDGVGVENGAFEVGGVWKAESSRGRGLVRQGTAKLGGYDGAEDQLSQRVRVRAGKQKLIYRVRTVTREQKHPADGFVVHLTDATGEHIATVDSRTDAAAGNVGWAEETVDLSRFAGQTVNLAFLVKTDGQRPTAFYVDDVRLR